MTHSAHILNQNASKHGGPVVENDGDFLQPHLATHLALSLAVGHPLVPLFLPFKATFEPLMLMLAP